MTEQEKAAQGFGGVYSRSNYPAQDSAPPVQMAANAWQALKDSQKDYGHYWRNNTVNQGLKTFNSGLLNSAKGVGRALNWAADARPVNELPGAVLGPETSAAVTKAVDENVVQPAQDAYHWVADPATTPVKTPPATSGSNDSAGGTFGKNLLLGGGLGLGAIGTVYLLRNMMQRRQRQQRANKFQGMYGPPKFAAATDVLQTIQDSAGKAKNYALEAIGGGADKLQNHVASGVQQWFEPHPDGIWAGGKQKALGVAGTAAGVGGAFLLARYLNSQVRRRADKNNVEDARNEYLAALTGEKSAALDAAYAKYANLADVMNNISSGVKSVGRGAATVAEDYTAAQLLAATAGVGIGGTYMYNKTRNNALSANALKAQALKARMRSLPGTWIDPEELVKVKQMALANNAAAT